MTSRADYYFHSVPTFPTLNLRLSINCTVVNITLRKIGKFGANRCQILPRQKIELNSISGAGGCTSDSAGAAYSAPPDPVITVFKSLR